MSIEGIDTGGVAEELSKKLQDIGLGDVSTSVSVNEEIPQTAEVEKTGERKYVGDCYIFDHQSYKNGGGSRPGSEHDVKRLKHDFKALDFHVHDYLNLTNEQTLKKLETAAETIDSQSKYFVCCFLTHGKPGKLLMHDKYIKIDSILKCFSRSSCKNLSGKPKIFIFQACRGNCCEEGVPIDSADIGPIDATDVGPIDAVDVSPINSTDVTDIGPIESTEADSSDADSNGSTDADSTDFFSNKGNPDYLDFLIAYSTYEGTYSFKTKDLKRNIHNHGSFFIDELCRTLEQFSDKLDLLQILTIVNYRVAYLFQSQNAEDKKLNDKKQMPGFSSRLRSEVKFNKEIQIFESCHTQYFDWKRRKTGLGLESTEFPFGDQKTYNIQNPKRIMFLSISNMKNKFANDIRYSSALLWSSVASKDFGREEKKNWKEEELTQFLKKVAGRDFSNTDCLICFITCKAKGDYLCDVDGNKFKERTRQIVEQFTGENCPKLKQKPKIFIFLLSTASEKSLSSCISADSTDSDRPRNMIPVHADILETVITFQESHQLEAVAEKFSIIFEGESSEDFLSQLTRMNDELVKDYGFHSASNKNLATFCVNSTLTKKLVLNNTKIKN